MIKSVKSKEEWNQFFEKNAPRSGAFLHSWDWGEFQTATGRSVYRYAFEESGQVLSIGQFTESKLPIGKSYLYCARGPLGNDPASCQQLLIEAGENHQAMFVRFDPTVPVSGKDWKLRQSIEIQPAHTLIMSLDQSEDELLSAMHQKTRYNLRLAEKKGVEIRMGNQDLDEEIWKVFETTASRGQFRLHDRKYYQTILESLQDDCQAYLVTAIYEGKVIAGNIMIDHNQTRTYLHGASSSEHRNVMAPYLLHWELIKDAKAKGIKEYDWWGVAPENAKNHPWEGISRFKLGFGGERLDYPGTYDLILQPVWYGIYTAARKGVRKF